MYSVLDSVYPYTSNTVYILSSISPFSHLISVPSLYLFCDLSCKYQPFFLYHNCLCTSLAIVFVICPIIFFKFCTHNVRYQSFCFGIKPKVNLSNSNNRILILSSTSYISSICFSGLPIALSLLSYRF